MISHTVRVAAVLAALLATPGLHAAEVAGVKIDEQIKVGNSELVLNASPGESGSCEAPGRFKI